MDDFVNSITNDIEALEKENKELKEEIKMLKKKPSDNRYEYELYEENNGYIALYRKDLHGSEEEWVWSNTYNKCRNCP